MMNSDPTASPRGVDRLRRLVEGLPCAAVHREGDAVHLNREAEALLGFGPAEPGTLDAWFALLYGPDAGAVRELYDSDRRAGFPASRTVPLRRADGRQRWVEFSGHAEADGELWLLHDVTDRVAAEEALRASEAKFATAFRSSAVAMTLTDIEDGVITDANDTFLGLVGRSREQALGRSTLELGLWADPAERVRMVEILRREGRFTDQEATVLTATGEPRRFLCTGDRVSVEGRDLLLVSAIDVTDRWRTEQALRQSQARLETFVRNAPVVLFGLDARGVFTFSDGRGLRDLGLEPGEVVGRSALDLYADFPEVAEKLRRALAGEIQAATHDMGDRVYDVHYTPLRDEGGSMAGVIGVATDVTARTRAEEALRESERRYRSFVENFPGIAFRGTFEYRPIFFHGAVEALTGYTEGDFVEGRVHWDDVVHPDDRPVLDAEGDPRTRPSWASDREYRIVRRDGEVRWVRQLACTFLDASGQPAGVEGTLNDVTDRRNAEVESRRLEEQVRHAQKLESLGVLAGGIAHDFNNLLMTILGNADLALLGLPEGHPTRRNLDHVVAASQRAADLCRQMLAYAGRGRLALQRVDLSSLVEDMGQLLAVSAGKRATLRYDLTRGLPPLEADPSQLGQVVMNLLTNAAEALGDTPGVVSVSTAQRTFDRASLRSARLSDTLPEGSYVVLEVSDTGCGMDEATLERIYDPFFSTKFAGRGLGLSAVLGIARAHRGAVRVDSAPGRGTTFAMLLPPAPTGSSAAPKTRADAPRWRGRGVALLADDEPEVRAVASEMLGRLGFEVLAASDGDEALELFRSRPGEISFALLDVTMPRLGGEESFRALRRLRPDLPVLLSSGYGEQEVEGRLAGEGLAGFVQKPYTLTRLAEALKAALG